MRSTKWIWGYILVLWVSAVFAISANARESIKIASIYSFTGAAAKSNFPSIQIIRSAVDEINSRGGVLGMPVELIEIDNKSSPIVSKIAAEKAVQAKVTAILGAAWSSHTLQIAKVAQANGIPLISNISTNPGITEIGDYIFRVCFNDLYQGWAMAQFAYSDKRLRRAVILVDITSDYSIGLAQSFTSTFERLGGTVVEKLNYKRRQQNYTDIVTRAAQLEPDVLFIPGHDESAVILIEAQRIGLKATLLGADGWDVSSFFDIGGRKVKHAFFSTHWSAELTNQNSLSFVRKYKGKDPVHASEALAYDAVTLLADAITRAGSTDRMAVRNALAQTSVFHGVAGDLTFNDNGDPLKSVVIMEIQDGVSHYLKDIQPPKHKIEYEKPSIGSRAIQ